MRTLLFTLFGISLFACAREVNEDARSFEERLLSARIQTKYLDTLHKTESGLYYMIISKGGGRIVDENSCVFVRFSTLDFFNEDYMTGTESSGYEYDYYYGITSSGSAKTKLLTSDELVAKQLGLFSYGNYYGPHLWFTGVYSLMEGIEEQLLTMREGDRRRIWLPSWLSSYGHTGSGNKYSVTTIHDIEVLRVVEDINQFQIDSLESYRDRYYPGIDSLSWGFYKQTLAEGTGDTLKTGNRVSCHYIGRTLDGFIFDLNIADSAKKYNIFDVSNTYDALEGECKEDEKFEVVDSNGEPTSFISGFSKAIFNMKHGEEAVVFFHSDFGYGLGSTDITKNLGQFQPYSPLVFYLKVERTNFGVDDEEDNNDK